MSIDEMNIPLSYRLGFLTVLVRFRDEQERPPSTFSKPFRELHADDGYSAFKLGF